MGTLTAEPSLYGQLSSPSPQRPPNRRVRQTVIWTIALQLVLFAFWVVGQQRVRQSNFYQSAVLQATHDARVSRRLGTPIAANWRIRTASRGSLQMIEVGLTGAKAVGELYAVADLSTGTPHFLKLEVYEPLEDYVMNLLPPGPSIKPDRLQGVGAVYLVPFSKAAEEQVRILPAYYKNKFNLDVQVLPIVTPLPGSMDASRGQYSAEWLLDSIRSNNPEVMDDPLNVVIGVTDADVFAREFNWPFTFNYRDGRFAVISLARLDSSFLAPSPQKATTKGWSFSINLGHASFIGPPHDSEILSERFRKVTTKVIGSLYYQMEPGGDTASVLGSQAARGEIDRLSEDILATDSRADYGYPTIIFSFKSGTGYRWPVLVDRTGFARSRNTSRGVILLELGMGRLYVRQTDFRVPSNPSVQLTRVYNTFDEGSHSFGLRTGDNYDISLSSGDGMATVSVNDELGLSATLVRASPGPVSLDTHYVNQSSGGHFGGADLYIKNGKVLMSLPDGQVYSFQLCGSGGPPCPLIGFRNGNGDEVNLQPDRNGAIVNMTATAADGSHQANPVLRYTYDEKHSISDVKSTTGEELKYAYDDKERLVRVDGSDGDITEYAYDENSRMIGIRSNGNVIAVFEYDDKGRASIVQLWDGTIYNIAYVADESGSVLEADITGSDGTNERVYPKRTQYSREAIIAPANHH